MKKGSWQKIALLMLAIVSLPLTGCKSLDTNPDPFEPMNRKIFAFNKTADNIVLKPVAKGYAAVVPKFARRGLDNFFNNASDTSVIINDFLQLQFPKFARDVGRMAVNTTLGMGGFIDVGTSIGWERVPLTFGDTLTRYGMRRSPYLVLPFLGPSTIRDAAGIFVDFYLTPWGYIEPEELRIGLLALYAVNARSTYLDMEKLMKVAAFDEYILMREVFFQQREARLSGTGGATDFAF